MGSISVTLRVKCSEDGNGDGVDQRRVTVTLTKCLCREKQRRNRYANQRKSTSDICGKWSRCGPRDIAKFETRGSWCQPDSLLADGGAQNTAKKYFLTVPGTVGYRGRRCEASAVPAYYVVQEGVCRCWLTDETEFHNKGILNLPELWQKGIDRDGYFVEKRMIRQTRCFSYSYMYVIVKFIC
jgi:hypothetical protein